MSYFDECKVKFLNIKGGDIPDDEYFKLPGISNSRLKYINPQEGGSPELFQTGIPFAYNPSLAVGTGVHNIFLQNDDYELSNYEGKPSAKLGYFIDCLYNHRKNGRPIHEAIRLASVNADYYAGKLTKKIFKKAFEAGKDYYFKLVNGYFKNNVKEQIVLPKAQLDACKKCLKSLSENKEVKAFLSPSLLSEKQFMNEIALFSDIEVTLPTGEVTVIPFKGKLDQVIIDHDMRIIYLNDLKTTSKSHITFMGNIYDGEWYDGSFQKLHYFRQFGVYFLLLQMYCDQVLGLTDYNYMCNVIVVETTGEHKSKVFPVNNSYIQYGLNEFKQLICRVAYHNINGYDKSFEERDN